MEHHNTPCTAPCARSEEPVIAHRVYESPCIEVLSVSVVSAFLALSGQTGGWHNDTNIPMGYSNPIEYAATHSAKDMPNVNDLTWYIQYGNPHFDGTTEWHVLLLLVVVTEPRPQPQVHGRVQPEVLQ